MRAFERLEPRTDRPQLALQCIEAPYRHEWDDQAGKTRHGGERDTEEHRVSQTCARAWSPIIAADNSAAVQRPSSRTYLGRNSIATTTCSAGSLPCRQVT